MVVNYNDIYEYCILYESKRFYKFECAIASHNFT